MRTLDRKPAIAGGKPVREANRYLVFGAPTLGETEIGEVVDTLRSGWIGTGPRVARFERDFAAYTGARHSVAVASCSAGLHLAMRACNIGPGDEVIATALTFCATVNAVIHTGATPVLVDCDPDSLNLDPAAVEAALSPRTKAIVPVHFAGRLCDMQPLLGIAERHDLRVIEDCAHAIETLDSQGRHAGTLGDLGAFSFDATHNVTTGEGGMLTSNRPDLAERIKVSALHGLSVGAWKRFSDAGYRPYEVIEAGFKCNMTDLQAAIGIHQLARVELNLARREAIWRRYDQAFADLPLQLPPAAAAGTRHARHLYSLQVEEGRCLLSRDHFLEALHAEGIGGGVHYRSLSDHEFYQRELRLIPDACPTAADAGRRIFSIPLSAGLDDDDVGDVIEAVRRVGLAHAAY